MIFHQWFLAWLRYCHMKDQFQIHSNCEGTMLQAWLYFRAVILSCSRDTKQSSGEGGRTVRTKYNVNALCILPPKCLQILSKRLLHYSTSLLPILDELWVMKQLLKLQILWLLTNLSFWWNVASDEAAFDDVITPGALCLQEHLTSGALLFRCFKLPFCWFLCSLLFIQNLCKM